MRSDDLETRMRRFETALDAPIPPGFQIVARLDGRSFTRLTHAVCDFEAPFDRGFHDLMAATSRHLMECGFNILLAYSESDEISLLFHPEEGSFGRKPRKLISVLAGEASGAFSLVLGKAAAFDARLSVLPGPEQVVDWRIEQLQTVARQHGLDWRQDGTSHCVFIHADGRTLPVPAQRPIKPIYIKKFIALVKEE